MSVEKSAWTQLKSQWQGDTTLSGYVHTWKFNRKNIAVDPSACPLLVAYPIAITEEQFIAVPKQKFAKLQIKVSGKINNSNMDTLEENLLTFDEYVKNAVEKDLQLGGKATIANIGDTDFNILDDDFGEFTFVILITLPRFTAGNR